MESQAQIVKLFGVLRDADLAWVRSTIIGWYQWRLQPGFSVCWVHVRLFTLHRCYFCYTSPRIRSFDTCVEHCCELWELDLPSAPAWFSMSHHMAGRSFSPPMSTLSSADTINRRCAATGRRTFQRTVGIRCSSFWNRFVGLLLTFWYYWHGCFSVDFCVSHARKLSFASKEYLVIGTSRNG